MPNTDSCASGRGRITRRDFVSGVAVGVATGAGLSSPRVRAASGLEAMRADPTPPRRTGMRGTSDESRDVAHAVAMQGKRWSPPTRQTDAIYDLIVVGAGLSGLATALFFRQQAGTGSRILLLDTGDDFGGNARRNEFDVDGHKILAAGGTEVLMYPRASFRGGVPKRTLDLLGVDFSVFEEMEANYDHDFFKKLGLKAGIYFDKGRFGDRAGLRENPLQNLAQSRRMTPRLWAAEPHRAADIIDGWPVGRATKAQLRTILTNTRRIYGDVPKDEYFGVLATQTYRQFLDRHYGINEESWRILSRPMAATLYNATWDVKSALDALFYGLPGFGLSRDELGEMYASIPKAEPYIYHFPDGAATVTRMMVRKLVPSVSRAADWREIILAELDYGKLDRPEQNVRIRLRSTAVDARNVDGGKAADVTYVRNATGAAERVRGRHVVLACWNFVIPFICPDVGKEQAQGLRYMNRNPQCYVNVALRRWRGIVDSGYGAVAHTDGFYPESTLGFPLSIGGYHHQYDPDKPALYTCHYNANKDLPSLEGLSSRDVTRLARANMLATSFADFERGTLAYLDEIYGPYGMDVARDVAAITVNRWPHGYVTSYDPMYDDPTFTMADGPHVRGRERLHRISIGNSDAMGRGGVQDALRAAARAVDEQIALRG